MKIIPAIDLRNGKCVRLFQGDYAQETIYSDSPVDVAKKWTTMGAQALHLIDLDGAREGKPMNLKLIERITKEVSIPIQVGGGIRNTVSIYRYIETGSNKIILGTAALEDRKLFTSLVDTFANQIIVSLDVNNNALMKNGWKEKSDKGLLETVKKLEGCGVRSIIYTDTIRDGTLTEPNYKVVQSIMNNTKMKVIIAGGISSIDQIEILKDMNVYGVIIGKALYEGKINLKEAIKLC